jgi:choline dehydrogenase-like flavoprotein
MQVIAAILGLAFVGLVGLTVTFARDGAGGAGGILPTVLAGAGAALCLIGIGVAQNRWRHARLDAAIRRSRESADESNGPAADEHRFHE